MLQREKDVLPFRLRLGATSAKTGTGLTYCAYATLAPSTGEEEKLIAIKKSV